MSNLHFLHMFVPEASWDIPPEMRWEEIISIIRDNVSEQHNIILDTLLLFLDIEQLQTQLASAPTSHTARALANLSSEGVPYEIEQFFLQYPSHEARHEAMHVLPYTILTTKRKLHPFVRAYFSFEHICRLILAHLRQQPNGTSSYEHVDDNDMSQWLFYMPTIATIWNTHKTAPLALEEALTQWKIAIIREFVEQTDPFSFDRLLAYLVEFHTMIHRQTMRNPMHIQIVERLAKAL